MKPAGRLAPLVACVAIVLLIGGCDPGKPSASAPAAHQFLAPTQVVEHLIELHAKRDYAELERWTVPGRAATLLASLRALDEFLAANEALCDYARDRLPIGTAEAIDLTRLARNMHIFSPYVRVLGESIDGDTAEVTFQVDGGFPLRRAALRRIEDRWRYDPGEGFDPSIPDTFREMAAALREIREELTSGRIAEATIRGDDAALPRLIEQRLGPALARLRLEPSTKAATSAPGEP